MADAFADGSPLHGITFATHSCILAQKDHILFSCEDIGRHNALDKVIGYALRHNIDLHQCMVYSSGGIPTDMTLKVIHAGIPILSSKASPTSEAIESCKKISPDPDLCSQKGSNESIYEIMFDNRILNHRNWILKAFSHFSQRITVS